MLPQIELSRVSLPYASGAGAIDEYAVANLRPELVAAFADSYYRASSSLTTFDGLITHSAASNATMVDSDGLLKWRPHNIVLNSATPATQSITVISGADYTVECTGVSIALSGAGTGTVTEGNPATITASTTTLTLTVTGSTGTMWAYRSDLGGMVNNPDTGNSYVPTTSDAVYLPRRGHHVYNGSAWVNEGLLIETEARTNLLHTTNALVTQTITVTAVPHTLHFTGTGTVTLSGASTDGPLVGTGTGEQNRVSLTFTPTAGLLMLIVTGTVADAQLEVGSTPSSYIPNLAASGTVNRTPDILTIPSANLPWPTPKVIGPELVTNGTFDTSDITSWGSFDGTLAVVSGELELTYTAATQYAWVSVPTEAGKTYQFTIDGKSPNAVGWKLLAYADAFPAGTGIVDQAYFTDFSSSFTTKTINVKATSGTTLFMVATLLTAGVAYIDNVSVREIDPLAVSIQMDGRMTYADTNSSTQVMFYRWGNGGNPTIDSRLNTSSGRTGQVDFIQIATVTDGIGETFPGSKTPGILQAYNIASRHGSTFINGAIDGTALTADTTPVALPDLSATDLQLGYDYMGTISLFRIWADDLGDTGIAEASA